MLFFTHDFIDVPPTTWHHVTIATTNPPPHHCPNMCFRLTPIPSSYKVLPPIEKPLSREDFEQSAGQSASTASDSYLVQQFKTRDSYKVSALVHT